MILDKEFLFSENQAITGTANSTNVVDLGVVRDIGKGVPLPLLIQVTADFNGADTIRAEVQTDDNESFTSAETLAVSGDIPIADLVAGYQFPIQYMPIHTERYLRVVYTFTGATAPTQGTITAGIVAAHQHGH
ncbi:Bbp16 family capsid cement protein [Halomonas salifodinae]|uniref:Bbp16 family capsid cement protein n=1 Tax=Halomonas salifodinae TaxID=438745 RepID=A0ABW2EYF3_9GAMM